MIIYLLISYINFCKQKTNVIKWLTMFLIHNTFLFPLKMFRSYCQTQVVNKIIIFYVLSIGYGFCKRQSLMFWNLLIYKDELRNCVAKYFSYWFTWNTSWLKCKARCTNHTAYLLNHHQHHNINYTNDYEKREMFLLVFLSIIPSVRALTFFLRHSLESWNFCKYQYWRIP